MNISDYKRTLAVIGAISAAGSGACLGYLFAHREMAEKFDQDLDEALGREVDKLNRYYATRYKTTEPEDHSEIPDDVVIDAEHFIIPKEKLKTPEGRAEIMAQMAEIIAPHEAADADDSEETVTEVDVFDAEAAPTVDIGALIGNRSSEKPYVISKEEYLRNDARYDQFDLTFFEKDGVLIDEQDDPIPDSNSVVGDENLQLFGVMSENNNVVYVQNDKDGVEAMFRIHRDQRSSTEHLFGVDEEDDGVLEHSSMKRRRPRRSDD